ncbi:MAG: glycine cleavage system aminomethyltransferase GcvT [Candidatus Dormibacteraeota bacterium]|nr:glycine cleavage system aminomethyltransferase GcvT [Candidatus Dormibacteraeota bacterium]
MSELKRTPLHARHLAAGGRMVDFAGWEMPLQYTSVRAEELAVRERAGLFDVSHMGRFEVHGEGAGGFLQGLVTNDLSRLREGEAQYNLLCDERAGVLDDLVVYRGDPWRVVVNAANLESDKAWLREHAPDDVRVEDRSRDLALVALQGPESQTLLPTQGVDIDRLGFFGWTVGTVAGVPDVLISRSGYTGEDGFELFIPSERVGQVWDALVEAGATPAGLAARDVLRLEAGLRLHGNDMGPSVNPYEAGLGWVVKLRKGDFIGRDALAQIRQQGPTRKLVGVRGEGRTIPRHGETVVDRNEVALGEMTSGTWSYWLKEGIGMALLDRQAIPEDGGIQVIQRGQPAEASVAALPFYRGSVKQPGA